MAKLDARSILIILASFGLVAGTLILVQKRNGPVESSPASDPQAIAAPPSAPIELLGSSPAPMPVTAPAPVTAPPPAPFAASAAHHAIPAEASAPAPMPAAAAKPIQVASSAKPASVAAPKSSPTLASTTTHHAIPAESEPAPVSSAAAKPVASAPVKPASAPVKTVSAPAKPATKPALASGHYFLQAGAFKDENNAQKLIAKLKTAGFTATESSVGELHKVLVGPYATSDAAAAAKIKLKAKGFDTAFVAKK